MRINLERAEDGKAGAGTAAVCGGRAPRAVHMLGSDAAEPDPRTPQLRPRRPDPARLHRGAGPRPGAGRAHPRRRLRLRARAVRGGRGARRLGDDLRRPLQDGRDGGRGAAGRRADARPSGCGAVSVGDRRAARRARAAAALRRAARLRARLRAPARRAAGGRARPGGGRGRRRDARGLRLPRRPGDALRRLRRGARPPRPRRPHGIAREAIALLRRRRRLLGRRGRSSSTASTT